MDLESIAMAPPGRLPAERGDVADPRPWLEAFDAGVGSPLELKFLRLFETHGLEVTPQVGVGPNQGDPPISIADFVLPGSRVAIYVDGAAFPRGRTRRQDPSTLQVIRTWPAHPN